MSDRLYSMAAATKKIRVLVSAHSRKTVLKPTHGHLRHRVYSLAHCRSVYFATPQSGFFSPQFVQNSLQFLLGS